MAITCALPQRPGGLQIVNRELTFAEFWTDQDRIQYFRKKAAKCAEVLVPDRVDPKFLLGAYVCADDVGQRLETDARMLKVKVNSHLFFA